MEPGGRGVSCRTSGSPKPWPIRMPDLRWLQGTDKAYGGRAAADPDGLARAFLDWLDRVRFDRLVVAARVRLCRRAWPTSTSS
jgi:hypothetical protein